MALEMKPKCERCEAALLPDAPDARICSYECTFCASCSEVLSERCPNCGGELLARPRRQNAPTLAADAAVLPPEGDYSRRGDSDVE